MRTSLILKTILGTLNLVAVPAEIVLLPVEHVISPTIVLISLFSGAMLLASAALED